MKLSPRREHKLLERSEHALLVSLMINMFKEMAVYGVKVNFITRGRMDQIIPWLNRCAQKSFEKTLIHQDLFALTQKEHMLLDALRSYFAVRPIKDIPHIEPTEIDNEHMRDMDIFLKRSKQVSDSNKAKSKRTQEWSGIY
jgi:hypothetical protein